MGRGRWLVLVEGVVVHASEDCLVCAMRARRESVPHGRAAVARVGDASRLRAYEHGKEVPL